MRNALTVIALMSACSSSSESSTTSGVEQEKQSRIKSFEIPPGLVEGSRSPERPASDLGTLSVRDWKLTRLGRELVGPDKKKHLARGEFWQLDYTIANTSSRETHALPFIRIEEVRGSRGALTHNYLPPEQLSVYVDAALRPDPLRLLAPGQPRKERLLFDIPKRRDRELRLVMGDRTRPDLLRSTHVSLLREP
jgi:hypothetical protein